MMAIESLISKAKSNPAATALAVVALGAAVASASFMTSSKTNGLLPAVTEEEALEVMRIVVEKLKVIAVRFVRAAENIRKQIAQQGQEIDDAHLMKSFIMPHFETAFQEMQAEVFAANDVEEDEIEEAVTYYVNNGHTELHELSHKIKAIYKEFGGDVDLDDEQAATGESDLSLEDVISLLQELGAKMNELTNTYIVKFKETYGMPTDQKTAEAFQQGMMALSENAEKSALKKYNLTQMGFQNAMMKYQDSRELQQAIMMMQTQNQMNMQQHGFAAM